MFIGWNNMAEGWPFPVLPEKINIRDAGSGKDYDIMEVGKIHVIEKPELTEIGFESFFPAVNSSFVSSSSGWADPHEYVNYLNKWKESGHPVRFIYVGSDPDNDKYKINLAMSIESFERWEEGGSPGDIYFTLKLKQYRFYGAKHITAVKQANGSTLLKKEAAKRPDERVKTTTYTLKPGDTLIKVARLVYGDSSRWREIQTLNNIKDWEIKQLKVGRVLQLPK